MQRKTVQMSAAGVSVSKVGGKSPMLSGVVAGVIFLRSRWAKEHEKTLPRMAGIDSRSCAQTVALQRWLGPARCANHPARASARKVHARPRFKRTAERCRKKCGIERIKRAAAGASRCEMVRQKWTSRVRQNRRRVLQQSSWWNLRLQPAARRIRQTRTACPDSFAGRSEWIDCRSSRADRVSCPHDSRPELKRQPPWLDQVS